MSVMSTVVKLGVALLLSTVHVQYGTADRAVNSFDCSPICGCRVVCDHV